MFKSKQYTIKIITSLLIIAASLFCVFFGQGAHLHDLGIHISNHFDVHVHLHAHESHDEPMQADHNKDDTHQHEVSTSSDIIGTLTSPYQVSPDIQSFNAFGLVTGSDVFYLSIQQSPTLFDLPPPRPAGTQYYLFSFSLRGPPIA